MNDGLDSLMAAHVDRVVALAELVEREPEAESWDSLTHKAALGVVLAKHARALVAEVRERAQLHADVRR